MLVEIYGLPILLHVLYLTGTYAYYINREHLIQLVRWPGDSRRKQKPVASIRAQKVTNMQITNEFLVLGSDLNIGHDRGSSTISAGSSINGVSSCQAAHGSTRHNTTDQHRALPGNDNSTGLLATGHRSSGCRCHCGGKGTGWGLC